MSWDPITRIVGNLGIYTKIDFDNSEVVSCKSTSSLFRGYSVFMKGKDPRDAHFITSRICGICGDNHAVCSQYAQNMAYGVKTPPLGEWIVNLGEAAEYIFDHIIFQDNLVFVDFCEQMVKETNPSVLEKAEKTEAPHADVHGYKTIADIMRSYNPFVGETYKEALHMSRIGREMICLMEGRHVHPSTIYPGRRRDGGHADAVHRLPQPPAAVPRLHQEGRRHERRRVRLLLRGAAGLRGGRAEAHPARLLGRVQQPRVRRLQLQEHGRLGQRDVRHPRRRRRRRAGDDEPGRHQPRHPDPARQLLLRGLGQRGDVRRPRTRSATRSTSATRGTRRRSRSRRSATSTAGTTRG